MVDTLEKNNHYLQWEESTAVLLMPMLAVGYLEIPGLRYALIHGCGLDTDDVGL